MGLDNGIILNRNKKPYRKDLFPIGRQACDNNIEFAYWRKCWGIRSAILFCLGGEIEGKYRYIIDAPALCAIIEQLKLFKNRVYWEKYSGSLFSYTDYIITHETNIKNLEWLFNYKLKHPKASIYFYDSY